MQLMGSLSRPKVSLGPPRQAAQEAARASEAEAARLSQELNESVTAAEALNAALAAAQAEIVAKAEAARLAAARREALGHFAQRRQWRIPVRYWAPAAFSAAIVLIGLNTVQVDSVDLPGEAAANTALLEDLPLLSGEDDLELLDDLEFYLWLAESDIG